MTDRYWIWAHYWPWYFEFLKNLIILSINTHKRNSPKCSHQRVVPKIYWWPDNLTTNVFFSTDSELTAELIFHNNEIRPVDDVAILTLSIKVTNEWVNVSIRLPTLAPPVLANLYSHTSVCLDSRLICHSQMSSSEAAMPLIWLPHPQGLWTQPCHHSPPTSPPIALPSVRHGKSCTSQAWPAQEHFPPLCVCVCVCVGDCLWGHMCVTAWKWAFSNVRETCA